ncbi:unnamed protein product [Caretta caretta]
MIGAGWEPDNICREINRLAGVSSLLPQQPLMAGRLARSEVTPLIRGSRLILPPSEAISSRDSLARDYLPPETCSRKRLITAPD